MSYEVQIRREHKVVVTQIEDGEVRHPSYRADWQYRVDRAELTWDSVDGADWRLSHVALGGFKLKKDGTPSVNRATASLWVNFDGELTETPSWLLDLILFYGPRDGQ